MIICDFCNAEMKPSLCEPLFNSLVLNKLACSSCRKIAISIKSKHEEIEWEKKEQIRLEQEKLFLDEVIKTLTINRTEKEVK